MKRIVALILVLTAASLCEDSKQTATEFDRSYTSVIPLGAERIDLKPSKRTMYFLASAENPAFEGWHTSSDAHSLLSSDGSNVRFYPEHIDFRLTATAMRPDLLTIDSYGTVNIPDAEINDYVLHLGFRMLIFHGLDIVMVEPDSVRLLGMPADIRYDERIYSISFDLPQRIPITDRIVLEVNSPAGTRLCKFHLDLF